MKTKTIKFIVLILFITCLLTGCNTTPQRVLCMNASEKLGDNIMVEITNQPESNCLSVHYSVIDKGKDQNYFFTLEIYSYVYPSVNWSSYIDGSQNSPFRFIDDSGNEIRFDEDGAYNFFGEKTIFVIYDNAPEITKNYLRQFGQEGDPDDDDISLYLSGLLLVP